MKGPTNIELRATDEVAADLVDVVGTGISNEEITQQVDADLDLEAANSILDQTIESAGLLGVIAAGRETLEVLRSNKSMRQAAKSTTMAATAGAAATWIEAFLFS